MLLIGQLGSADDPPVSLEVVGSVPLEPSGDARGLVGPVTPLEDGPRLRLAYQAAPTALSTSCPSSSASVVVVVWAGGVVNASGKTDNDHLDAYRVFGADGAVVSAAGLGDLNDNDNYVHLCMDADVDAVRVEVRAGVVVDPRGDDNPQSAVEVHPAR